MKNSKLTMFCAYAMCFTMVLVINNQFEVAIDNMKYIILLLILGYGFVALLKLSNDKKILGNWIVFCIVIGMLGVADILYLCYLKLDKELFIWSCLVALVGLLISSIYHSCKIIKVGVKITERDYFNEYREQQKKRQNQSLANMGIIACVTAGIAKILKPTDSLMNFLELSLLILLIWGLPYVVYRRYIEYYVYKYYGETEEESKAEPKIGKGKLTGEVILQLQSNPMHELKEEEVKKYVDLYGIGLQLNLEKLYQGGVVYWGKDQINFIIYYSNNEFKRENISNYRKVRGAQINSINVGLKQEDGLICICPIENK